MPQHKHSRQPQEARSPVPQHKTNNWAAALFLQILDPEAPPIMKTVAEGLQEAAGVAITDLGQRIQAQAQQSSEIDDNNEKE